MQAIQTRYLGPTNHRGARIKATAQAGSIIIPYPYALSGQAAHRKAAQALADRLDWKGVYLGGQLPDGDYAFVLDQSGSHE